jgi:hypothetical protein
MENHEKVFLDIVAIVVAALGAMVTWIPSLASFVAIVYTLIRIYETKTVQKWFKKE